MAIYRTPINVPKISLLPTTITEDTRRAMKAATDLDQAQRAAPLSRAEIRFVQSSSSNFGASDRWKVMGSKLRRILSSNRRSTCGWPCQRGQPLLRSEEGECGGVGDGGEQLVFFRRRLAGSGGGEVAGREPVGLGCRAAALAIRLTLFRFRVRFDPLCLWVGLVRVDINLNQV